MKSNPRTKTRKSGSLAGMSRRAVDALGETVASLPPRTANLVGLPDLHPELASALSRTGVERLYSHQREAYERVSAGENVVVATATASGKSLCYKIPTFENALESAASRALFL
ncbi:MAG: DEAD/DEAH box helicase, partial [Actinobacteria bacterium]|nr:DEAD/DEAH box helicase [Actinomycetota bacterium]